MFPKDFGPDALNTFDLYMSSEEPSAAELAEAEKEADAIAKMTPEEIRGMFPHENDSCPLDFQDEMK